MTPWMRKVHKWLGVIIALQFVLWMASGLIMALLDHDAVQGRQYRVDQRDYGRPWPVDAVSMDDLVNGNEQDLYSISSEWLLDRPVYRLFDGDRFHLRDALDASVINIDADIAKSIAAASYSGPGAVQAPVFVERTLEARPYHGHVWRVDFDDSKKTTAYLSADSGEVLVHRNRTWRIFDIFWMLHIMDYTERVNFNNPLIIGLGVGGLWLALTGVWLLFASFRIGEFIPRRWQRKHEVSLFSPEGDSLRTVSVSAGDDVYIALSRESIHLPSNCGGGQSCGLCQVRVRGVPPEPTSSDRAHLTKDKLERGFRLACNLTLADRLEIEVEGGESLWTRYDALVERVEFISPFLREIVVRPITPLRDGCRPGSYIQVHIPPFSLQQSDLHYPEQHHEAFSSVSSGACIENREGVSRSYSLSLPESMSEGRLSLLVRLCHGQLGAGNYPPGKGSAYMYSLKPGDAIQFAGPYGDFMVKPGGREKIFIGGGAGMAPLRAMILDCLGSGAAEQIQYWYGSRSFGDAPYVEQMQQLADQHPNFSWSLVLSEESGVRGAHEGLVHQAVATMLQQHPAPAECDFYVCGPPGMLAATRDLLHALGVPDERVAFDDFKI